MDFNKPNNWLNVFLNTRKLEKANPLRPLYTYQTTIEE